MRKPGSFKLSMLDYYKKILVKVSFDLELFKREFKKAVFYDLVESEVKELEVWIRANFSPTHIQAALAH